MKTVDALGKACPIPVIMANKVIDSGETAFTVLVDNDIAVENLKKAAGYHGYAFSASQRSDGNYETVFKKDGASVPEEPEQISVAAAGTDYMIFMGRDVIGAGERELGTNLARMFFFSLAESGDLPAVIAFMNAGVKLPTLDEQVVESLKTLAGRGVKILVCGACLNFYGLTEQLKIGEVSNMYDIQTEMIHASKTITL